MFGNLIESSSHARDIKRKGSFLFGTIVVYAVLLLAAGVASIYAYDTHLNNQTLELITLVTPPETPQSLVQPILPAEQRRAASNSENSISLPQPRRDAPAIDPTLTPEGISTARNNVIPSLPNLPPGTSSDVNFTNTGIPSGLSRTVGAETGGTNRSNGEGTRTQPPPPMPAPSRSAASPRTVSLGVINGRATHKPHPPYPTAACIARAQGQVTVQIVVDETGRVISAHATSGHQLLRAAAVEAARRARFSPTLLSNQPVRVSGAITYNFVIQ